LSAAPLADFDGFVSKGDPLGEDETVLHGGVSVMEGMLSDGMTREGLGAERGGEQGEDVCKGEAGKGEGLGRDDEGGEASFCGMSPPLGVDGKAYGDEGGGEEGTGETHGPGEERPVFPCVMEEIVVRTSGGCGGEEGAMGAADGGRGTRAALLPIQEAGVGLQGVAGGKEGMGGLGDLKVFSGPGVAMGLDEGGGGGGVRSLKPEGEVAGSSVDMKDDLWQEGAGGWGRMEKREDGVEGDGVERICDR